MLLVFLDMSVILLVFAFASLCNCLTIEFFTIGLSDAFLSDYLTDFKLHSTK